MDAGLDDCLYMGNLDSLRDWGHARDYVEMQWLMLQQEQPEDFVIATGRQESVRRFIELIARELGWGLMQWMAKAPRKWAAVAIPVLWWCALTRVTSALRVSTFLGDPSRAKEKLGWSPTTTLEELGRDGGGRCGRS